VGEATDEEEHRHDLQQPGHRLEHRHQGERVRRADVAVASHHDDRHQPVPDDDGAE
jgi:hypothetical protein